MLGVLRRPGVAAAFLPSCVARLPMGALGLLVVLRTHDATGSYARGGLVTAVLALAEACSAPALARLVDRRGQTGVLRAGAPVCAAAVVAFAALAPGAPDAARLGCVLVAGLAQPPVGACMRALWPALLDDPGLRHRALATEGVVLELTYLLGPVAIVGGVGSWSLPAALVVCAVAQLAGSLAFARHPLSRATRGDGRRRRDLLGALREPGVQVLVVACAAMGLAVGAFDVAIPARLGALGHRELTGPLLGLWGAGSMVGGVLVGRLGPARRPATALAVLVGAWGVLHAATALAGGPVGLAVLIALAGGTIAPTFTVANGLLGDLAPDGALTEAFTWMTTGMVVGAAAGSALAGLLTEAASPRAALAVLGGAPVLGALAVLAGRARVRAPVPHAG